MLKVMPPEAFAAYHRELMTALDRPAIIGDEAAAGERSRARNAEPRVPKFISVLSPSADPPVRFRVSGQGPEELRADRVAPAVRWNRFEWRFGQMCCMCPRMFLNRALAVDDMIRAEPSLQTPSHFIPALNAREDQRC